MTEEKIVEIFCEVDDFTRDFVSEVPRAKQVGSGDRKRRRKRAKTMSLSETMTIQILFHCSGYRTFKDFYLKQVTPSFRGWFPDLVSYTRFLVLIPVSLKPLSLFLETRFAASYGVAFIDSTKIQVCHRKRIKRNKVFKGFAKLGKSSMGWFYGFQCHIIVNHQRELVAAKITPGNVDDRKPIPSMTKGLVGKLFGDKGYLSQPLFESLLTKGLQMVTYIKKNMKNKFMLLCDKILLRKRSLIETVNDQLKNIPQIEHSRHRSPINAFVSMTAALIAYTFQSKKPSIRFDSLRWADKPSTP